MVLLVSNVNQKFFWSSSVETGEQSNTFFLIHRDAKPDIKKNVSKKKSRNRNTSSVYLSENNSDGNERPARTRKLWTDEESKALEEGIALYGHDWVAIHKSYPDILRDRSPVNLKDRARSLRRIREREGTAPGTYPLAPS